MSILYEKISQLCEKRGITRYKMCKEVGIQPSIVTDLKSGRKKGLSADVAQKIANYFNVTVAYLLGVETEQKEKPAETGRPPKYDLLNERDRALVDDLIERLYKAQSDD